MSLSIYHLEDGRHLARLHRRRRRRARPRAIPLAMITTRKSIYRFPLVSYMGMGLRLAGRQSSAIKGATSWPAATTDLIWLQIISSNKAHFLWSRLQRVQNSYELSHWKNTVTLFSHHHTWVCYSCVHKKIQIIVFMKEILKNVGQRRKSKIHCKWVTKLIFLFARRRSHSIHQ